MRQTCTQMKRRKNGNSRKETTRKYEIIKEYESYIISACGIEFLVSACYLIEYEKVIISLSTLIVPYSVLSS